MKTRNGFVSNSSSSSFIIIGVEVKNNIANKRLILHQMSAPNFINYSSTTQFTDADINELWEKVVWDDDAFEGGRYGIKKNRILVPIKYETWGEEDGPEQKPFDMEKTKEWFDILYALDNTAEVKMYFGNDLDNY